LKLPTLGTGSRYEVGIQKIHRDDETVGERAESETGILKPLEILWFSSPIRAHPRYPWFNLRG